jgi:hypothetical protein
MISLLFSLSALVLLAGSVRAGSKEQDNDKVSLPRNLLTALNECCSMYEIVRLNNLQKDLQDYFVKSYPGAHPGMVEGDFDGDGTKDYALLLRTKRQKKLFERLVVFKSPKNRGFDIVFLTKDQEALEGVESSFIRLVPKGSIVQDIEHDDKKAKKLIHPGIEFHKFESAAAIYYWGKGKFNRIQTAD